MAGDTGKKRLDEGCHPVIALVREMDESAICQASLNKFLECVIDEENSDVGTMTKFMKRYAGFQVFDDHNYFLRDGNKSAHCMSLYSLAFSNLILATDIKWSILKREFYQDTSPVRADPDLSERLNITRILRQVEGTQGNLWVFKEKFVQTYLAACYQVEKLIRATSSKAKRKFIGKKLTRSINQMPTTSDLWLMTFGLVSEREELRCRLPDMSSEFFGIFVRAIEKLSVHSSRSRRWIPNTTLDGLEAARSISDHVSCFFVELVNETSNGGDVLSMKDRILENESVNYSGHDMTKGRALFCLNAIGGFLNFAPALYGIHLTNMNIHEGSLGFIVEPLIRMPESNLQVLNLSNNAIGHLGMRTLFRFLVRASELTHLDVSRCNLGDRGIALIVQTFICMPLVYINLSGNGIGDAGSKLLSRNLWYVPSLEWLDLSNNQLGSSAAGLVAVLTKLPCLRFLNLGSNRLDDEGAVALARLIEESPAMEEVVASRNAISGKGCRAIADKIGRSKSLRNIDLRNNKIPNSGVLKLRKAARSHGSLQVSAWEQNLDSAASDSGSECGKETKKDAAVEKLLGRLDFQLSIAISKVGEGSIRAKMKEGVQQDKEPKAENATPWRPSLAFVVPSPTMASISSSSCGDSEVNGGPLEGTARLLECGSPSDRLRFKATGKRPSSIGMVDLKKFIASKRQSAGRLSEGRSAAKAPRSDQAPEKEVCRTQRSSTLS